MTEARPKCLVELAGRPLLDWQVAAMRAAGIRDIKIVTGYRQDLLENRGLETRHNPIWSETNMVGSLWCARDLIDEPTIVSYSDIVYAPETVRRLLDSGASLGLSYDRDWYALWSARFADPLSDAESFQIDASGAITDIGRRVKSLSEINGQYMGLLLMTPATMGWLSELHTQNPEAIRKLAMTDLLRHFISEGRRVAGVPATGGWCEVDTPDDLRVAEGLVATGRIAFPKAAR